MRRQPLGWLDAAVVVGSAVTAAACALPDPRTALVPAVAVGLAVVAWFAFGRATLDGGRGWPLFVLVLVAVSAAGAAADPAFATFQVVALPLAWMVAPGWRTSLVVNAAIVLAIGIGYAQRTGPLPAIAVEGVSFGFSVFMGAWISRIARVSEERRALVDELTAAQERIAALGRDAGAVAERERLARELHDTLAQSLAGIVMLAERARARHPGDAALEVLEESARQAMTEARGLVTASAGVPMDGVLAAALETLAARVRRETGLAVDVSVATEVPRGLEVVLLRCAQEGLANVRKHADARSAAVAVVPDGDAAVLTVADDGRGPGDGDGFGIAGMRDRLALVDGSVDLAPGADRGSVLTVRVPAPAAVPT